MADEARQRTGRDFLGIIKNSALVYWLSLQSKTDNKPMLMENKQLALSFGKGITNVPSDAICDDNTLEESLNMVYENGEHRPIQKPKEVMTLEAGYTLLFVHNGRMIVSYNNQVGWMNNNIFAAISTYTGSLSVSAIGNTLVLSHGGGIAYAKWNGTAYESFSELPDIVFTPRLVRRMGDTQIIKYPLNREGDFYDIQVGYNTIMGHVVLPPQPDNLNVAKYTLGGDVEKNKSFQNYITAGVEDYLRTVKKDYNAFVYPFWVRYALVLYDGTITKLSAPILMFPSVRTGVVMRQINKDGDDPVPNGGYDNDWFRCVSNQVLLHFNLFCNNINGYDDIISGVKIYVSKEVRTEKTNDDKWDFYSPVDGGLQREWDCVDCTAETSPMQYKATWMDRPADTRDYYKSYIYAPQKSDKEIMDELISSSVFYELCNIPYSQLVSDADRGQDLNHTYFAEQLMVDDALVNLVTLPQLPHDDYFSHAKISEGDLFAYNSRINIFSFKRKAFEGFKVFTAENTNSEHVITIVSIQTESGDLVVKHEFYTAWFLKHYFFYPDSRASKAEIYLYRDSAWKYYKTFNLKEYPYLNGAYAFDSLPYDTGSVWNNFGEHPYQFYPDNFYPSLITPSINPSAVVSKDEEDMYNTIVTSEVNNPFVFYAEGYNRVGDGVILGLATQTVALSGGTEFGSQPLIVFTDKGLWSMQVSNTGLYQSIRPMGREVCNNTKSIIQTDGAVFFSSEKGLMIVVGSEVRCVSEQLRGKLPVSMVQTMGLDGSNESFASFIRQAFMAYDYRDSLLWIFDGATHGSGQSAVTGSRYCYVYSLKEGVFGRYDFGAGVIVSNVVNSYPDYLLQIGTKVFSLLERPDINEDGEMVTQVNPETHESEDVWVPNIYGGTLVTRPMKFDNALALKSIMRIQTVKEMAGQVRYEVYASNDLKSWKRLLSLRGTPHKYYRMVFRFTDMLATDRFGGIVAVTQERRVNKLR